MKALLRFYREFPDLCHVALVPVAIVAMVGLALAGVDATWPWAALAVLQLANLVAWKLVPRGR